MVFKLNLRTLYCIRNYEKSFYRLITTESLVTKVSYSFSEEDSNNQSDSHKKVPVSVDEYKELRRLRPCQPTNPHLLKVSILGEPNVGKSTLTNSLVKWKVCAVSSKVHTTRKKSSAVLVKENKQIVFLDTPGFVTPEQTKKHALEPSFVMDPVRSIMDANLVAVVVDIANKWTNNRINETILETLEAFKDKKSILLLNKVDAMKSKDRIFSFIKILTNGIVDGIPVSQFEKTPEQKELTMDEILQQTNKDIQKTNSQSTTSESITSDKRHNRGWSYFSRVFLVSALKNNGIDDLREYLFNQALPCEWMYHDTLVTDQHPHEIALMVVREKLLEYLPQEIPYLVNLKISKWELLSSGCPKIDIKISCSNSRHKRFIIGPNGKHIAACADRARKAMRESFRKDVVLHLAVD